MPCRAEHACVRDAGVPEDGWWYVGRDSFIAGVGGDILVGPYRGVGIELRICIYKSVGIITGLGQH